MVGGRGRGAVVVVALALALVVTGGACAGGRHAGSAASAAAGEAELERVGAELVAVMTAALDRLEAEGWGITDVGRLTGDDSQHYTAGRAGFVLSIGSTATAPYGLVVGGSTPCVNADGSHYRRGG